MSGREKAPTDEKALHFLEGWMAQSGGEKSTSHLR